MAHGQVLSPQNENTAMQKASPVETSAMVLAAQAKALVEARYIVAMQRPRDLDEVREALLKECRRARFAEVARYSKPKGKKKNEETGKWEDNYIKGPSIRFAEAALRCMKNIDITTITVYDDREKRIVRVSVSDIENNIPYSQDVTIQKAIERSKVKDGDVILKQRLNSYGNAVYLIEATDDEILDRQNALISKAVRTLGLRLVPGDLIDEAMEEILATQSNKDAEDPDAAKKRLFDAFAEKGVSVVQIKEFLGHGVDTLEPKELTNLRGIFSALRDGETTWREVMDDRKAEAGEQKVENKAEKKDESGSRTASVLNKVKQNTKPSVEERKESAPIDMREVASMFDEREPGQEG